MKESYFSKRKMINLVMLLAIVMQTIVAPVTAFSNETDQATSVEEVEKNNDVEEKNLVTSEITEDALQTEAPIMEEELPNGIPTNEEAKANDSPAEMEKKTDRTLEELLARENPYSVSGLSNKEIISLGRALFGDRVKADPKMKISVTNDAGEVIQIPFMLSRSNATSENKYTDIQYALAFQGWNMESYIVEYKVDGKTAFCIDPTRTMLDGEYTPSNDFPFSAAILKEVNLIGSLYSKVGMDKYTYATAQIMIWEKIGAHINSVNFGTYATIKNQIITAVASYKKIPSFAGNTVKLTVGQSVTITDTNGVLAQYIKNQGNSANVNYVIKGNQLTLTPKINSQNGTLDFWKVQTLSTPMVYYRNNAQTLATFAINDAANFSLLIQVEKMGKGRVIKRNNLTDQPLSGAVYQVTNNKNKEIETLTTSKDGGIETKKYEHGTILTIREIKAPANHVITKETQTIQVEAGKVKEVTFRNKLQLGKVTLVKQDTETGGKVQGQASFENAVYGLYQADGTKIKEVALKNFDGKVQASIDNLQIEKDYYFKELTAPTGYNLSQAKIPFYIAYKTS